MKIKAHSASTNNEVDSRKKFTSFLKEQKSIPDDELLNNIGLFIRRQQLGRLLFMHDLYKRIINIHGVVMEFGTRWGQNLAYFENFRGLYEPFNYNRKVIGFDTFSGFASVDEKDGKHDVICEGAYGVEEGYENTLDYILSFHESESPISHIKKYELVKGDASKTIVEYFDKNPHTIVALAYFDMDIYKPTKDVLKALKPHLTKGSVIGFDELNYDVFPGETIAFQEELGSLNYSIRRSELTSLCSYIIVE